MPRIETVCFLSDSKSQGKKKYINGWFLRNLRSLTYCWLMEQGLEIVIPESVVNSATAFGRDFFGTGLLGQVIIYS